MEFNWKEIEKDVAEHSSELIERLVNFSLNDVLLYWSTDVNLRKEQEEKWLPILQWIKQSMNIEYHSTDTFDVPAENINRAAKLKECVTNMKNKELAAFYTAAINMRSVLLALALVKGKITAQKAFELSELEELYQARKWGSEPLAEARRNSLKKCLLNIEQYINS